MLLDGGPSLPGDREHQEKPLSQGTLEISQRIGLTILIFIMFLAIYNDLSRVKETYSTRSAASSI
jgi:membrane-associated protease RseP (regulator of RpoE activity)